MENVIRKKHGVKELQNLDVQKEHESVLIINVIGKIIIDNSILNTILNYLISFLAKYFVTA
jgi:hypothetical protein